MKTRVLYIEDEEFLGKIVRDTLENEGYNVYWLKDGGSMMQLLKEYTPDICIVDIMLPSADGYTIASHIKGLHPEMPIIFLTAKSETRDVLKGFNSGGTDYIKKPFSLEELIARIENQLQIVNGKKDKKTDSLKINLGIYTFYPWKYELHSGPRKIKLSNRDTEILSILAANKNSVVDRKEMLMTVWGDDSFFNSRNLDVYVRKLRKYLSEDRSVEIKTLKGKGYMLMC
ncbi:MAG: response regulator transcription factor [Bacteroidales bacterium]|nr:response regulator transcription factor [Bacteroidales bacterium]